MNFERGTTNKAREKTIEWLTKNLTDSKDVISLGLPEYDDRFDSWRVPLHHQNGKKVHLGEIKLDNKAEDVIGFTEISLIRERVKKIKVEESKKSHSKKKKIFRPAAIPNQVVLGNCLNVLNDFPPDTAQLVFTSPPYFNAKPEYSEYVDYEDYLDFMKEVITRCYEVLSEGRFFVINTSPVLIRRTSRNTSSRRLAIPFDLHVIIEKIGFEFIDDIIWAKPEGAGWNLGRGRRFKADRNALQYKPVPVTEHVMVYRKKTDKLIDWNLRNHYDPKLVEESKILGDYEVTDIWKIHPGHSKIHPAVFPEELAKRVIQYYSFKDDLVLDPFGGTGTTGRVAQKMDRRFLLIDNEIKYFHYMRNYFEQLELNNGRVDFDIHESFEIK
ncbi:MAG: hypothetical protein Tsb0034_00370 [Ekhidna sp.]